VATAQEKKVLNDAIERLKASLVNAQADVADFAGMTQIARAEVERLQASIITYEAHLARMT
jgi:hypothetical protein